MSSAALYNYFATKSELLTAAVHEIEEVALPRLRAAGRRDGDVIDRLSAVLDESGLLMQEYPYLAAFERATSPRRSPSHDPCGRRAPSSNRCARSSPASSKMPMFRVDYRGAATPWG